MEEKWIPTAERLPNQMEFIESYVRSEYAAEFLVTIEGTEIRIMSLPGWSYQKDTVKRLINRMDNKRRCRNDKDEI